MDTFAAVLGARAGDPHPGLRCGESTLSWGEVVEGANRRAAWLLQRPAPSGRGRHVAILLDNVPEFVLWLGAAALTGSVLVPVNPTRRGAELVADLRHTDCDLIVTAEDKLPLLPGPEDGGPVFGPDDVVVVDTPAYAAQLAAVAGAPPVAVEVWPGDPLLMLFSSGSTGAPKAVICTQGRLALLADTLRARTEIDRDSVTYVCMPLFHGNSLMLNLAPAMRAGATVVLAPRFSASGFARDIARFGITYVNYVGRALSYVLAQPVDPRDADSTLQLAIGTEASAADVRDFAARFGARVEEGYGMSEGVIRINRTPDTPADALGVAVGGLDVRVLNEESGAECPRAVMDTDGRVLNADEAIGQIVAVGAAPAFEGYYRNPEATAQRIRGEDFWTGDLAWRDGDGFFWFAGRSSDWLRVDSENFAAAPVERLLERHPAVAVAAVYAVPDPRTGDRVMCAVQMAPGVAFDPLAFADHLLSQRDLPTKAWPTFVRVCDRVPTTGSNKVAKAELRTEAWLTADPVFISDGRGAAYRRLDDAERTAIAEEFARRGRAARHPAAPAGVAR